MGLTREKFSKDIISFDGKTLCGTAEKGIGIKGLHILNAWSKENGICIGQLKVDDKSNVRNTENVSLNYFYNHSLSLVSS
jgi:hypothetical protein